MQIQSCGIDFGTSNSTIGIADAKAARLIRLEDDHLTLPSAVFFEADSATARFGRDAIAAYVGGEDGRLMRGLKSTLGSSLVSERTRVGTRSISFRDIVARFFGQLRARLDMETGGHVDQAVLGRPIHFVDGDAAGDSAAQAVLEEIARGHGFRHLAFQYEPIAAALHYEQGISGEEVVLVADIGGGTSDFSILRVSPRRMGKADRQDDILANDGIRVGGTDFDRLLSLAEVMPHLGLGSTTGGGKVQMPRHYYVDLSTWHRINMVYTTRTMTDLRALWHDADRPDLIERLTRVVAQRRGHTIAMAVEAAKIALSAEDVARLSLSTLTGGPNPVVRRAVFDAAVAAPVGRIAATLAGLLQQAGLTAADIGSVFMTGGSSHLPILRACISDVLPGVRIVTGDMLGSVGAGLALDAQRKFG